MLVLARKSGQSIRIGDDIEVFVLDVQGETVRLGINAPRTVRVLRAEVIDDVTRQNRQAAMTGDQLLALLSPTPDPTLQNSSDNPQKNP